MLHTRNGSLPYFFKPLLWSYDFSTIDPLRDKKIIIINTINYGDLRHWKWLVQYYGQSTIAEIIAQVPSTTFRPAVLQLASIIFDLNKTNDAS